MADEARCEELRQALADLRARLEPGARGTAVETGLVANYVTTPTAEPNAPSHELEEEIRNLEQALQDAGCE